MKNEIENCILCQGKNLVYKEEKEIDLDGEIIGIILPRYRCLDCDREFGEVDRHYYWIETKDKTNYEIIKKGEN